jgi:hypothetical protein
MQFAFKAAMNCINLSLKRILKRIIDPPSQLLAGIQELLRSLKSYLSFKYKSMQIANIILCKFQSRY